jgi:hypothetical protein
MFLFDSRKLIMYQVPFYDSGKSSTNYVAFIVLRRPVSNLEQLNI